MITFNEAYWWMVFVFGMPVFLCLYGTYYYVAHGDVQERRCACWLAAFWVALSFNVMMLLSPLGDDFPPYFFVREVFVTLYGEVPA